MPLDVIAEIEVDSASAAFVANIDPSVTMLSDFAGMHTATVANGKLQISGTSSSAPRTKPAPNQNNDQQHERQ